MNVYCLRDTLKPQLRIGVNSFPEKYLKYSLFIDVSFRKLEKSMSATPIFFCSKYNLKLKDFRNQINGFIFLKN